jgi:hypothetical protein
MRQPAHSLVEDELDSLEPLGVEPPVALRLVAESPAPEPVRLDVPTDAGRFHEASVAQDGGPEGMPVRRGSQHQYRAVLHEAIVRVADALDTQGVCDRRGRLRRSWISSLEGLIREARAIDEVLDRPDPLRPTAPVPGPMPAAAPTPNRASAFPHEIEAFLDRMDGLSDPL